MLGLFPDCSHHVNAVENAHNAVLPPHQCPIHAVGIPRVENLLGVGGADGGDTVGSFDGALHQVDHAVKFQQVGVIRGDSHQLCDDLFAVYALILDVVNGIENADVLVFLMILVEHPIENGNHCGLPVVAVDDVRLPASSGRISSTAREKKMKRSQSS